MIILHYITPYQSTLNIPANRLIEDLRLVEKYAIEIGVLEKRVVVFKKKELNNEVDRLDKEDPYSVEEMRRYRSAALKLIKSMRLHYLVPALCLLATGLLGGRSKSMIFSLRWDQINYASNTLKFLDTKNGSTITLDFDYRLKAILRIMLQHRQTINHRDKRYAYVFPTAYKHLKQNISTIPEELILASLNCLNLNISAFTF